MSNAQPAAGSVAGLGFEKRSVLYVHEVAEKLRVTKTHVVNLIDEGILSAVNIGTGGRKFYRIPIEAYDAYVAKAAGLDGAASAPAPAKPAAPGPVRRPK